MQVATLALLGLASRLEVGVGRYGESVPSCSSILRLALEMLGRRVDLILKVEVDQTT